MSAHPSRLPSATGDNTLGTCRFFFLVLLLVYIIFSDNAAPPQILGSSQGIEEPPSSPPFSIAYVNDLSPHICRLASGVAVAAHRGFDREASLGASTGSFGNTTIAMNSFERLFNAPHPPAVLDLDVWRSVDGVYFVGHPGDSARATGLTEEALYRTPAADIERADSRGRLPRLSSVLRLLLRFRRRWSVDAPSSKDRLGIFASSTGLPGNRSRDSVVLARLPRYGPRDGLGQHRLLAFLELKGPAVNATMLSAFAETVVGAPVAIFVPALVSDDAPTEVGAVAASLARLYGQRLPLILPIKDQPSVSVVCDSGLPINAGPWAILSPSVAVVNACGDAVIKLAKTASPPRAVYVWTVDTSATAAAVGSEVDGVITNVFSNLAPHCMQKR